MFKINFWVDKIQKVKVKLGLEDKIFHFQWMEELIFTDREEALWVVGGFGGS